MCLPGSADYLEFRVPRFTPVWGLDIPVLSSTSVRSSIGLVYLDSVPIEYHAPVEGSQHVSMHLVPYAPTITSTFCRTISGLRQVCIWWLGSG